MTKHITLKNAPIEEVIFSLITDPSEQCNLNCLNEVATDISNELDGEIEDWISREAIFEIGLESDNLSHNTKKKGYVIKGCNERVVVHISDNAFIMNKLKPYVDWSDISTLFEKIWSSYERRTKPKEINKVSIRYVNKFDVPQENWDDYLLMYPVIHSESENDNSLISVGEVFSRYNLQSDRYAASSVVMLNIKAKEAGQLSVIMDIDVDSVNKIENYSSYKEISDVVDRLRDFKNHIFFSNIPKAKEMFN